MISLYTFSCLNFRHSNDDVFTARCTKVQSTVLRLHVVRLSVRLSVTLVDGMVCCYRFCVQELHFALQVFNFLFTSVFVLEALVKITALGFGRYIKDRSCIELYSPVTVLTNINKFKRVL